MANRMGTLYEYDADLKNILRREKFTHNVYSMCEDVYKRQVKVIISTFLAHVRRHTDRVQYKIKLSAQYIHRCLEYIRQIFHRCG